MIRNNARLIIYFANDDLTHASWVLLNTNSITQSIVNGEISALFSLSKDTDVTVLVPSHDVFLTQATLPKLSHHRLLQALPFSLEEKIIDDISQLHFAIENYQPNLPFPVAIVSHKKMQAWIHALKQFELSPSVILPISLAGPFSENTWKIITHEQTCSVRTGKYSGFGCDKNNLDTLLELKLAENPIHIEHITCTEQQLLEKIAETISAEPVMNLLQRNYPPKRKTTHTKKIWTLASYAVLISIIFGFFSHLFSFLILQYQANSIQTTINQIYQRNFPDTKTITSPKQRMEEKLKKLIAKADKNHFLLLLAKTGKVLSQTPDVRLHTLDFRNNQLTLDVTTNSFDTLDNLTQQLTEKGLSVKQQNASTIDAQVKATLSIQQGAS